MNTADLSHHWLPFTANRAFAADPRVVVSAEGVHYLDTKGRRLLDGISGLFCVPAGHGRPEIAAAVSEQLRHLDFAPTFQFAHPAGFTLAEKLSGILPSGLDRVFFVNSGSEAVETALKGALAYHRARGDAGRTALCRSRTRLSRGQFRRVVRWWAGQKPRDVRSGPAGSEPHASDLVFGAGFWLGPTKHRR